MGDINAEINNIKSEEIKPEHQNDTVCAPGKQFDNGSCYTLQSLIYIANAYNKENPNNQIKLNATYETLIPKKYKRYLVKQLKKKLQNKCTSQKCWSEQSFMRNISKINKEEIDKFTFRPDGPEGKFEWLNTLHIDDVMSQYEQRYPDFKFLGAVPMDFDDLESLGIANLDFKGLYANGIRRLGIIFNLDEHWKSGSHWVAGFTDLNKGQVRYFDSYGIRPEPRVRKFMKRCVDFCQMGLGMKNATADYNRIRHQYKNSECGVYSINFITRLLKGHTFEEICDSKVPDDKINKCRKKYFTKAENQ